MKKLINDLNALIDELKQLEGLAPIDRDILLEKIRRAYEVVIERTDSENVSKVSPAVENAHHMQPEETIVQVDTLPAIESENVRSDKPESVSEKRAEEFSRSKKVTEPATLFDVSPDVEKPIPMSSVHEKISDNAEDVSLADKLKKNPVEDLKKSIGINEKFSFINELFDGDLQSYNSTIDQLNNCSDLFSANQLLTSTAEKLSWEPDSETLKKLSDLIERRFRN